MDGDASGGPYAFLGLGDGTYDTEEGRRQLNQHAQNYTVLGEIFGGSPHVCLGLQTLYGDEDWFQRPPYAEGGELLSASSPRYR